MDSGKTKKEKRAAFCRALVKNVYSGLAATDAVFEYCYSYGEDLIEWALFTDRDIARGLQVACSRDNISAHQRWDLFSRLIFFDLWPLNTLMPHLASTPEFRDAEAQIWASIQALTTDFCERYPDLKRLEEPLGASKNENPRAADRRVIRVGVWSRKISRFGSSMTTVHPWLMALPGDDLEVFILSEQRREGDWAQESYRHIFGENFIDCDGLSDAAFMARVQDLDLDLDVLIPIHTSRLALADQRLARCHLDIFAQLEVKGVPDQTLVSNGTIDEAFLPTTARNFIAIPDPMLIFSSLPDVALGSREPDNVYCFGVFSRLAKANDAVFDVWARILKECPGSKINVSGLLATNLTRFTIRAEMAARGVEPMRVKVFEHMDSHTDHLARYNAVDLMIDTFPMGGAVSAVDSFYMGVPVLGLNTDRRPSARVLRTLFAAVGSEAGFIANSPEEYVQYAKMKFGEGPRDKPQREKLRTIVLGSSLFDHKRYAGFMRDVIRAAAKPATQQVTYIS